MSLLKECLKKIENTIDPEHCEHVKQKHIAAANYEYLSSPPIVITHDGLDWPTFDYCDIYESPEKMLISELAGVYMGCLLKDDRLFTIRANLGIGVIPSLFGCNILLPQPNQKPWAEPIIKNDFKKAQNLIENDVPDITCELGKKAIDTAKFYRTTLADYPKLSQAVHINLPDTQGPFDLAHILWGSEIYYALMDAPDLVHAVLKLVTQTYIDYSKHYLSVAGDEEKTES